LQSKHML